MLHRIGSAILPTIKSLSGIDQNLRAPLASHSPLFYGAIRRSLKWTRGLANSVKMERKAFQNGNVWESDEL